MDMVWLAHCVLVAEKKPAQSCREGQSPDEPAQLHGMVFRVFCFRIALRASVATEEQWLGIMVGFWRRHRVQLYIRRAIQSGEGLLVSNEQP
jgi:hypothetical protein